MQEKGTLKKNRRSLITIISAALFSICMNGCEPPIPPEPIYPEYPGLVSKIGFVENTYGTPMKDDVYIINTDGTNLKKIYNDSQGSKIEFSPDGEKLTFAGQNTYAHEITDLDGNNLYKFQGGWRSDEDFTWTPDGKNILFGRYNWGIYEYNLETNSEKTLLSTASYYGPEYDHNPVMSPDLEKIVYTHHEYESNYWIYIKRDGKNSELIANGTGTSYDEQLNLNWVDNDNFIWKNGYKNKIYYCNINTKEVTEISAPSFWQMRLSPDKKTLAIYGEGNLNFIDTSELNSGVINPKDTKLSADEFDWAPDSNYFVGYFNENIGKVLRIGDKEGNLYNKIGKDFGTLGDVRWSSKILP